MSTMEEQLNSTFPLAVLIPILLTVSLLTIKWWFSAVAHTRLAASSNHRLPSSPPKLPIIGNLHQLGKLPHRTLQALAHRYGPVMLLHFGQRPTLIVSSARMAREVMKTNDLVFSDRPKSDTGYRLLYQGKDVALAPYGKYWRQMRSICVLHLLSTRRVQLYRSVREEEIASLLEKVERKGAGVPMDLSDMFASTTNDIVCRVALGKRYDEGEGGRKFTRLLGELMELLGGFNVGNFIPSLAWLNRISGLDSKIERVAKEFDEFLERVVDEHMINSTEGVKTSVHEDATEEEGKKDFVDVLLEIQRDGLVGFPLGKINIKAIILDMFSAGTDTTYTVLEWAMTQLLRHPAVMKKLQDELRKVSNGKSTIRDEDLDQMPYLKAVLKETLRLHPPIPLLVPRVATRDVNFSGYDVAAGTTVITNAWAIGRDPASWPLPEEFMPERFLDSSVDYKGQDFELIPFGSGRRGCPGMAFAMATNELVLANLINRFNWALPEGVTAENVDMTECRGLTIHRKVHLLARATPHSCSNVLCM